MKSKDFFSLLKEQGKINDPKFDELIEKTPEFEIDNDAVKAFEDRFMTVARAASHPEVTSQVRALALKPLNRDLDKIIGVINEIDGVTGKRLQDLVQGSSPDTYKRMEVLSTSLGELFDKVKKNPGGDEELKKELEKKKKFIDELTEKFTNVEKEYSERFKNTEKEFEEKLHDYKLDSELEKLAGTFTLAEAYDKNRPAINKVILSELKSSNRLRLGSKDGQTTINILDDNGQPRFDGNSPVQIQSLLEEKYKPFLKQSNAETTTTQSQSKQTTVTVTGTKPAIRRGADVAVK